MKLLRNEGVEGVVQYIFQIYIIVLTSYCLFDTHLLWTHITE